MSSIQYFTFPLIRKFFHIIPSRPDLVDQIRHNLCCVPGHKWQRCWATVRLAFRVLANCSSIIFCYFQTSFLNSLCYRVVWINKWATSIIDRILVCPCTLTAYVKQSSTQQAHISFNSAWRRPVFAKNTHSFFNVDLVTHQDIFILH